MGFDFNNEKPIYLQIVDQIHLDMITGVYACSQKLPPVRDMAMIFKVNPNTMQRAFQELEKDGLVYSERTSGRYVTDDPKKIEELKRVRIQNQVKSFIEDMEKLQISKKELINLIENMKEGVNQ